MDTIMQKLDKLFNWTIMKSRLYKYHSKLFHLALAHQNQKMDEIVQADDIFLINTLQTFLFSNFVWRKRVQKLST